MKNRATVWLPPAFTGSKHCWRADLIPRPARQKGGLPPALCLPQGGDGLEPSPPSSCLARWPHLRGAGGHRGAGWRIPCACARSPSPFPLGKASHPCLPGAQAGPVASRHAAGSGLLKGFVQPASLDGCAMARDGVRWRTRLTPSFHSLCRAILLRASCTTTWTAGPIYQIERNNQPKATARIIATGRIVKVRSFTHLCQLFLR
jgi:hypothetical protein